MKLPSSKDEKALDAMFRRARTEPDPADLHRVKQQLHTLAAQVEARPRRGAITAITATMIVVALGLLPSTREFAMSHVFPSSSPEPAPVKAEPEKAKTEKAETAEPKVALGMPVAALASVPEEPRPVPVEVVPPPRPRHASSPSAEPKPKPPTAAKIGSPDKPASREAASSPVESTAKAEEQSPSLAVHEEGEASFLRRAKVSLATDPSRALQMAEEHPSRYPRAVLAQEREVIAIEALSRLGRTNEARARAEAFRSRYPHSAHNGHIDGNINAPPDPKGR